MPTIITYAFVILSVIAAAIQTTLADPNAASLLSPTVKSWMGVAAVVVLSLMNSLPSALKARAGSRSATPPLPLLMLLLVLAFPLSVTACSASQQAAEQRAAPDCLRCSVELIPVFSATLRDGGADR